MLTCADPGVMTDIVVVWWCCISWQHVSIIGDYKCYTVHYFSTLLVHPVYNTEIGVTVCKQGIRISVDILFIALR